MVHAIQKNSQLISLWNLQRLGVRCLLIAILATGTLSAQADQTQSSDANSVAEKVQDHLHPYLTDRFRLHIGAFSPEKSYTLSANGTLTDKQPQIDFDETFNLSDSEYLATAMFHWQFGEKWFFETHYYELSEDGGAVLEEDISWGDYTFLEGTFAETELQFEVARFFLGKELVATPNSEFSFGIGVHWLDIDALVQGEVLVDGGGTGFRREEVGLEGPLPNLGFSYIHAHTSKLAFFSRLNWLSLSIDKWSGGFWDVTVGGSYYFTRHFSASLQYMFFDIDATYDDSDWRGDIDVTFKGPLLSVGWSW